MTPFQAAQHIRNHWPGRIVILTTCTLEPDGSQTESATIYGVVAGCKSAAWSVKGANVGFALLKALTVTATKTASPTHDEEAHLIEQAERAENELLQQCHERHH